MNKVKPILLGMCLTTLVGCTSISLKDMFEQPVPTRYQPLGSYKELMRLHGVGVVDYVCSEDENGTYYKFININIELFDKKQKLLAEIHGSKQTLTYEDGGIIKELRPVKWGTSESLTNYKALPDVLFSVGEIQGNKKSEVVKVKFITRSHTQGGEPKLKCSTDQIGKEFKEPFNATFIFWGNK